MSKLFFKKLKAEFRDLIELVLVPSLAAFLPWPLAFRVFKFISRYSFLYRQNTQAALYHAVRLGAVQRGDENEFTWSQERRLTTLVDHADAWLAKTRSDKWMRRHLQVRGEWPSNQQAALLCTFHWGAGMWALRHAHESGLSPAALIAPMDAAHFKGRRVLYWYARQRIAAVEAALGHSTIDVSKNLRPALKALRNGGQLLAAVDVPADQTISTEVVQIFGRSSAMPSALFRLAVDQKIPVTVYTTGFCYETGFRYIEITNLGIASDELVLMKTVFSLLSDLIARKSSSWHFWSESERFFQKNEFLCSN